MDGQAVEAACVALRRPLRRGAALKLLLRQARTAFAGSSVRPGSVRRTAKGGRQPYVCSFWRENNWIKTVKAVGADCSS
jgi:hypothetical protein